MPTAAVSGKRLAELWFTREGTTATWVCKCGCKRTQKGPGYSNLTSNIHQQHSDFVWILKNSGGVASDHDIRMMLSSEKGRRVHSWIDMVVHGLYPFSFIENKVVQENVTVSTTNMKTLMKYMARLARTVEPKISQALTDRIAVMFDGWSCGSTHFVGVIATYPSKSETGYSAALIGMSPLENEEYLSADEQVSYLDWVLQEFGKTRQNVVCLIGDNCSTDKAISMTMGIHLLGCANHRFNLAVQGYLEVYKELIYKVHKVMAKIRPVIAAAKLRKHTALVPILENKTRWSSTFEVLRRYKRIRGSLPKLDVEGLDELGLNDRCNRNIEDLCDELQIIDGVTKALQRDDTTVSFVSQSFDTVIEKHPRLELKLSATATIVHYTVFESAVVKIQSGHHDTLTDDEKDAVKIFSRKKSQPQWRKKGILSLVETAKKKKRLNQVSLEEYIDLRFLVPTSNQCERLFSKAGFELNSGRRAILPSNFEAQIFLHINGGFWGIRDVNEMVHGEIDDEDAQQK